MEAVLRLRGVETELSRLVEFAEKFSWRVGLPDSERARLLIILEELFTNAISHGYPDGASGGRIEVTLALEPGQIKIEFSDDGRPFDPLAQQPLDLDRVPTERPIGGLGLHLLRSLIGETRYRREGGRNYLTLVRDLPRPG